MLFYSAVSGNGARLALREASRETSPLRKEFCMDLTDEELAGIPTAPRAKGNRVWTKPVVFRVAKDPAVVAIAKMVVAGVDKKHDLHPDYCALLEQYGRGKAHELIERAVVVRGSCDGIQTDMGYGGIGLFGGLSKNGSRFTFYEWSGDNSRGQLSVSMTKKEARDIVSGKKRTIVFRPERFCVRLCINPFKREYPEKYLVDGSCSLIRSRRSLLNERVYTKDESAYSLPRRDYDPEENRSAYIGWPRYPDKFRVLIGGKLYDLAVSDVNDSLIPAHDKRIHIVLKVPPEMRAEVRKALSSDGGWKLRSRHRLLLS